MADAPLHLPRYIKLVVDDALSPHDMRGWLRCVRDAGPSGVISTQQMIDDEGQQRAIKLVHRESDDRHEYLVPLTRDLAPGEVDHIVRAFADDNDGLDFDIETNQTQLALSQRRGIKLDGDKHIALCSALAKQKHEDWYHERADAGWRYGPSFSVENKTHPLLLPWDQLPDRFRQPDLTAPQKLIDMLGAQGYAVLAKEDIDRVVQAVRGTV